MVQHGLSSEELHYTLSEILVTVRQGMLERAHRISSKQKSNTSDKHVALKGSQFLSGHGSPDLHFTASVRALQEQGDFS